MATCKHTCPLGRYSWCVQEAALNTTNYWARGGDRDNGAGDPRKASRACPDQAICLQGLRGRLGGGRHSRAAGEGWRGESQPSSASPPGEPLAQTSGVCSSLLLHSSLWPAGLWDPSFQAPPALSLYLQSMQTVCDTVLHTTTGQLSPPQALGSMRAEIRGI